MEKLFEDGTDIFQILEAVEKRTGIFILNRNLDCLYCFIAGYKFLANETKIQIKNIDKLEQFSLFLKDEFKQEHENTMGWFGQLHSEFGSELGFYKFFEYLRKFRNLKNY